MRINNILKIDFSSKIFQRTITPTLIQRSIPIHEVTNDVNYKTPPIIVCFVMRKNFYSAFPLLAARNIASGSFRYPGLSECASYISISQKVERTETVWQFGFVPIAFLSADLPPLLVFMSPSSFKNQLNYCSH